jgi:hypothetical protein
VNHIELRHTEHWGNPSFIIIVSMAAIGDDIEIPHCIQTPALAIKDVGKAPARVPRWRRVYMRDNELKR